MVLGYLDHFMPASSSKLERPQLQSILVNLLASIQVFHIQVLVAFITFLYCLNSYRVSYVRPSVYPSIGHHNDEESVSTFFFI